MEILSAGTFINLENQEKIEQLKFTAAELANAAMETEGFVNTEESGKSLALEFWQGLEYMSRESEEATIKNIFLNHFLDRLRSARPIQTTTIVNLTQDSSQIASETINSETKSEDEFLGVIETTTEDEDSIAEIVDEVEETSIKSEYFEASENDFVRQAEVKTTENVSSETVEETALPTSEIEEKIEPSPESVVEAKTAVGNLSVPEKEPYQWGKCTVTATIQLLPVADGSLVRKAVLSVKTHDFAPQFSLVELAGNNLTTELMPELEKVLAEYKNDLPAKVMDKLKKEKLTAKKTAPKSNSAVKTASQETAKPKESGTTQTTSPEANQASSAPVVQPPAQAGQQGNLFGF
ncbi:MAG TPA: hypothetical protein PKY59_04625 [Pyrinomonadaceae bacterium]|nr:hypothetical protein [Pyrinomonadaceae bacterium]